MEGGRGDGEGDSPPQEQGINSGPGSPVHYSEGAVPEDRARTTSPHATSEDYKPPLPRKGGRAVRPCRVPGCAADVTGLKSYNWRYRICEEHRSAPSVVIDGMRVRFCQMCAKFHELAAFQGRKMSCQKKLDGHNARRRVGNRGGGNDGGSRRSERVAGRSSSGGSSSLNLGGSGGGSDTAAGVPLMGLAPGNETLGALTAALAQVSRQLAAAQAPAVPQWPGIAPLQHPPAMPPAQTPADLLVSLLRMAAGAGAGMAPPPAPAAPQPSPMGLPMLEAQALLQTIESFMGGSSGATQQPSTTDTAAPQPSAPTAGMAAPVAVRPEAATTGSLGPILEAVLGGAIAQARAPTSLLANGAAHAGTAPTEGAVAEAVEGAAVAAEAADAPAADVAVKTEEAAEEMEHVVGQQKAMEGATEGDGGAAPPPALPAAQLVRLSIKLFGCEPHQLEPSVHHDLLTLLSAEAEQLEAYVRPGCTAVTLDLRVPMPAAGSSQPSSPHLAPSCGASNLHQQEQQQALGWAPGASAATASLASEATVEPAALLPEDALQAVNALLGARRGEAGAAPAPFVVQVGGRVAVGVGSGAAVPAVVTGSSRGLAPALLSPEPRAVVAGRAVSVTLRGRGIAAPTDLPLCRQRGANVTLDVLGAGVGGNGSEGLEWVTLRPLGLTPGCAELEVERGALLSEAVPLLVLPDSVEGEVAAAEVCAALGSVSAADGAAAAEGDRFLREVGWVLQHGLCATQGGDVETRAAGVAAVAEALGCPTLAELLCRAAR